MMLMKLTTELSLSEAEEDAPSAEEWGQICAPGHYCPEATIDMHKCPPGTFRANNKVRGRCDCWRGGDHDFQEQF